MVALVLMTGCAPTLTDMLKTKYNMDLLRPASSIYVPGTIAAVQVIDAGSERRGRIVSLRRYCKPGSGLPINTIAPSNTETFTVVYDVSNDGSAKAEIENIVGFDAGFQHVDKVEINLTNATIYRPDDLQLRAALRAIRASGCSISGRSQVTAVLQADVEVKTTFNLSSNLTVSQKRQIGRLIGASLGAKASVSSGDTTTGTGLFYGIETDERLF